MESLPKDKLLQYNPNTLEDVRKLFGLNDPGAMKDAVVILEEWVKKQHHFTNKNIDRRYLEATIIISKGYVEAAKSRLDKACTIRTLIPHIFKIYDIREICQTVLKDSTQAVLPKMTKNHERVVIHRNTAKKLNPAVMLYFNHILPSFAEYMRRNDYAISNHVILDYLETDTFELTKRLTLADVQETAAYGLDRESLKKIFDKEILPKEYGGHEKTLAEIQEEWLSLITSEEYVEYLKEINSCCTDESKRQNCIFNQEYMGVPGSFRKMNVD